MARSSVRSSSSTAARSAVPASTYSLSGRSLVAGGRWSCKATRAPFSKASSPPSSESSPASARRSVVLPTPFGPESASRSRRSILNETPSKSRAPASSLRRLLAIRTATPLVWRLVAQDPTSSTMLRAVLDSTVDGIAVTDLDGNLLLSNRPLVRLVEELGIVREGTVVDRLLSIRDQVADQK